MNSQNFPYDLQYDDKLLNDKIIEKDDEDLD